MMAQARQMQARLAQMQQELAEARTEASAGGGVIRAVVIGGNKVESIKISPEVVDPEDVELLEDLVTAAVNEALETAHANAASKMGAITGGLNIPGLT
jgi:DNA-binding YbaB/EbfC family protein